MPLRFSFQRLFPLLCSLVAFILAMLALFAGSVPGILEEYDILSVDTSGLGAEGTVKQMASKTRKPHLRDFYSLYALAVCEGDFTPDGSRNITACHRYFSADNPTISALLNHTLQTSPTPTNLTLSDLGLTAALSSALNNLTTLFKAAAALLAIGAALSGLSALCCAAGACLHLPPPPPSSSRRNGATDYRSVSGSRSRQRARKAGTIGAVAGRAAVWSNLVAAAGALVFLVLGGLVATVGARVAARNVNRLAGDDDGDGQRVRATAGTRWVVLAWVGAGLVAVVLLYWVGGVVRLRRGRRGWRRGDDGGGEGLRMGAGESLPMRGVLGGVRVSRVRRD